MVMLTYILLAALIVPLHAFRRVGIKPDIYRSVPLQLQSFENPFDMKLPTNNINLIPAAEGNKFITQINATGAFLSLVVLLFCLPEPSVAVDGQYGILAGKTASMLHPVTNFALFGSSIYSAYLGLQWRRLRRLSEAIKGLNSQLPILATTQAKFPLSETMAVISKEIKVLSTVDSSDEANAAKVAALQSDLRILDAVLPLDLQYQELTKTRKSLQSANLKDKHHNTGSILLGAGVSVSILGAFNTYMRAGRLFPGPHLYAGMAITILWACKLASIEPICIVKLMRLPVWR
jgi:hypothetical protein